ncbi:MULTISPECIES: hypothetical protein [unclassified Peribacillus]
MPSKLDKREGDLEIFHLKYGLINQEEWMTASLRYLSHGHLDTIGC